MKNSNLFILLSALLITGCTNKNNSSSNLQNSELSSSTSVNSLSSETSSNSSSISSSSGIDKTYWINKGNAQSALNNAGNWYYNVDESKVNLTNASYYEEELFFDFNKVEEASWNSVELFYHHSNILEENLYTVTFDISSTIEGDITVNGKVVSLTKNSKEVSVEGVLINSKSALEIQFGTKQNGYLGDAEIIISELSFAKEEKYTFKSVLAKALAYNNYTVEMIEHNWGEITGTYTFLEKAAFFKLQDGGLIEYRGFAENDEGVFGFTSSNGAVISRNQNYYYNNNDEIIKGLYTTREKIDFKDNKGESLGVPSLNHLNVNNFDFELVTGEVVKITNTEALESMKVFARMGGEYVNGTVYSGIKSASVVLNEDSSFTFEIKTKFDSFKIKLSNIGTTANDMLEDFINSNQFGPINMTPTVTADPVVLEMLKLIDGENYTVKKADGSYLYITEKYSYSEFTDEDNVTTAKGFVVTDNGSYSYVIIDGEVTLGEMDYSIDPAWSIKAEEGLKSSTVSYFDSSLDYKYNETAGRYEMIPPSTNYSYMSFSSDFFGVNATACNLITLHKDSTENKLYIGGEFTYVDENENSKTEYLTIEVFDFGTTEVEKMENYLA